MPESLLALLSLYELIRKRTDTDVAFTMEFTLNIKSKERLALPDLELFNRTY
jgi:hypothetical protein